MKGVRGKEEKMGEHGRKGKENKQRGEVRREDREGNENGGKRSLVS